MNPGLLRNGLMAALAALLVACGGAQPAGPGTTASTVPLPDWSGIWVIDGPVSEIATDGYPHLSDNARDWPMLGLAAPYNDAGKAAFDSIIARLHEFESRAKTDIWGFPLMMDGSSPLQFFVTPQETLVINQHREIRHLYTDGRAHPKGDDLWVTTWGDAIAHWDGDTLVVETVSVRQPGAFNLPLPVLSEEAVYTERLRRTGKDTIENEMTIVDPKMLRKPWVVEIKYKRATDMDRMFHDSFFQNDRTSVSGEFFTIDPPAGESASP
jgi:hypothetical protein